MEELEALIQGSNMVGFCVGGRLGCVQAIYLGERNKKGRRRRLRDPVDVDLQKNCAQEREENLAGVDGHLTVLGRIPSCEKHGKFWHKKSPWEGTWLKKMEWRQEERVDSRPVVMVT